jgi:hypothetical protein
VKKLFSRKPSIGPSFWAEFIALAQKYNVKANLGLGFPNLERYISITEVDLLLSHSLATNLFFCHEKSPMFLREAAKFAIIDQDMNQYTRGVVSIQC